jgi:hypothetical protein
MSDQQSNKFSNLFSNTTTTPKDETEKIPSKTRTTFKLRKFHSIKTKCNISELSRTKDERSKMFLQRRMKIKITVDKAESLKKKLTKSNELYEQYNQMEVQPGTEDINQKYKGLVA